MYNDSLKLKHSTHGPDVDDSVARVRSIGIEQCKIALVKDEESDPVSCNAVMTVRIPG